MLIFRFIKSKYRKKSPTYPHKKRSYIFSLILFTGQFTLTPKLTKQVWFCLNANSQCCWREKTNSARRHALEKYASLAA